MKAMRVGRIGWRAGVGLLLALATGCRETTDVALVGGAELLGARVPAGVLRGVPFDVVGYFGRGACSIGEPVVRRTSESVSIAMRLRGVELPPGTACTAALLQDSVRVTVTPPFTVPFTVRLRRGLRPDSVIMVYEAPSA
jgi:hypothetical protein